MKGALAAAVFGVILLVSAWSPAAAYRTTRDDTTHSFLTNAVAWPTGMPTIRMHASGSADLLPADTLAAIEAAFAAWRAPTCTNVNPVIGDTTSTDLGSGDGESVIVWRESGWAALGYSPAQIAVTQMEYAMRSATEWDLSGGDIALNGENYSWVLEGGMPSSEFVDVQTILTHEAGHFLGLMHTCEIGGANGAPECPPLQPASAPTMWPGYFGQLGRTLENDDIEGICVLYNAPPSPDAGVEPDAGGADAGGADAGASITPAPDTSCCSVARRASTKHLGALIFFLLCIVLAVRRKQSGHDRH